MNLAIISAATASRKFQWGEVVNGVKVYACHDGQLDVLGSRAKYTAAFAGAQGGKTALSPLWSMKQISRAAAAGVTSVRGLVVSPTVPMRRQSQIVEHFETCYADTALQGKYNKGESVFKFSGGEILFRSADEPSSLDGGVYDFVIVDEAAKKQYTPECWQRIKVRAAAKDAPILTVSTPDMASCIYDEVFGSTKAISDGVRASEDGNYFMRVWASIDRPGYNLKAYEEAKRTMSPAMFARMFQGIFAHFEGLVYDMFGDTKSPKYPVIRTPDPLRLQSPAICTIGGIDFGFTTDPAAVLIGAVCDDGMIYVVDELSQTGLNNDQLAAEVIRLKSQWEVPDTFKFSDELATGTTQFYCDTEDAKAIRTLSDYGVNARKKRVFDLVPSIHTVSSMFRAGRLKIFDRCVNLIGELKRYQWEQSRSGEYTDKPVGKDDHLCDALRYMVGSHMLGKQITPLELGAPDGLSDEERQRQAVATVERLGIDADHRRKSQKKQEEQKHRQWLHHLATCEDD